MCVKVSALHSVFLRAHQGRPSLHISRSLNSWKLSGVSPDVEADTFCHELLDSLLSRSVSHPGCKHTADECQHANTNVDNHPDFRAQETIEELKQILMFGPD